MPTYYWGDWHRQSVLGPERGSNISPTGWALARGMIFTSHHDAPVAFPDSMRVLSSTVTRVARGSGEVVGPQHRVPPIVGLKAITLWAAYQHFEENTKDSIEPGKVADFVVLSANPIRIDPSESLTSRCWKRSRRAKASIDATNRQPAAAWVSSFPVPPR